MPLATKKNKRTEKVTPAQLDVATLPAPEEEQAPVPPKVTALVWSYNNAAGLRRCLTALEKTRNREALEILVVDKGSQDESSTLDNEFPNTTFLRLPRNFGNTKALNIGTRTAVGELLFFLSPEIEVGPDTIPTLAARLEADSDLMAVCPLIIDSETTQPVEQFYRLPTPATGADLTPVAVDLSAGEMGIQYATFQALMARKYFVRGINYFDERYGEFGSDAELCYQIHRASRKIAVLPDLPVLRTSTPVQSSQAAETMFEADRIHGAAVYFGKHYGFVTGMLFRLKQILRALVTLRFSLLSSLVSGSKIDGSQGVVL